MIACGLWKDVVWICEVDFRRWRTKEGRNTHKIGLWKAVMMGIHSFVKEIGFKVGHRAIIKFWESNEVRNIFEVFQLRCLNFFGLIETNKGGIGT